MKVKVIRAIDKPEGLQRTLQNFLDKEQPKKILWISHSSETIKTKDNVDAVSNVTIIFYE